MGALDTAIQPSEHDPSSAPASAPDAGDTRTRRSRRHVAGAPPGWRSGCRIRRHGMRRSGSGARYRARRRGTRARRPKIDRRRGGVCAPDVLGGCGAGGGRGRAAGAMLDRGARIVTGMGIGGVGTDDGGRQHRWH
jgi:hypothetical protein